MLMENFQLDKYLFNIRAFTVSQMIQPLLAGFMLQVIAFLIIFSIFHSYLPPLPHLAMASFLHTRPMNPWIS